MRYVLFATQACSFCTRARELLEQHKKEFKIVNFEEDQQEILKEIKDAYAWPTVPMVFRVSDDGAIAFIGGFSDLQKHLNQ